MKNNPKVRKFLLLFLIIFGVGASGITGYALVTGTPILSIFSSGIFSSGSGAKALEQGQMRLESESSTSITPQEITPTDSTAVSSDSASSIDPDAKIEENQLSPQGDTSIAPQPISVTTSQNPASTSSNSATTSSTASKPASPVSSSPESAVSSEPVSSAPDSSPSDHHTAPRISGVNLDKTQMTLNKGDISAVLTPTITPSNASGSKSIQWSTGNANIATVDNIGHVTAIGGGTATITATTSNGKTAACIVTVLVPASTIKINSESFSIDKGASKTLTATVGPEDATDKTVIWATSNNDVVLVDGNGKITAANVGTATITATTGNGKLSAICEVTVGISISTLTLDKTDLILIKGTEETLTVTIDPPDTTENKTVEWISSKPTVAAVDSTGRITAIEGGTAVITAQVGSHVDECVVTVIVPATGISLDKSAFTLPKGTQGYLAATITPEDATDKAVAWTSSDESIATVDSDGKITALSVGAAVITAKSHDGGFTAECTVTVVIPVTGITLDRTELTMNKGNGDQLVAAISPIDATDQAVTWSSSNPDVVSTDQHGSITAVSAGSAVISVTTHDGSYTASCNISVIIPINTITLNQTTAELRVEKSLSLVVSVDPPDTTEDKTVTWSSSDNNIASVDSAGTVTAINPGNVVITAKVGTHTTSCTITVKPKITATIVNPTDLTAGGFGTYSNINGRIQMSLKGNGRVGSYGDQYSHSVWVENSKGYQITIKFSEPIQLISNVTTLKATIAATGGNVTYISNNGTSGEGPWKPRITCIGWGYSKINEHVYTRQPETLLAYGQTGWGTIANLNYIYGGGYENNNTPTQTVSEISIYINNEDMYHPSETINVGIDIGSIFIGDIPVSF